MAINTKLSLVMQSVKQTVEFILTEYISMMSELLKKIKILHRYNFLQANFHIKCQHTNLPININLLIVFRLY